MARDHGTARQATGGNAPESRLTVLVPAYNEADSIVDTVRSLCDQTHPPAAIIVIDDGSTDATGDLARQAGALVVRPPANTGSKAGAQNYALSLVDTEFTMAVDADTVLAPDAIATLMSAMAAPHVAAACGMVLPRHVQTVWERGRYIEYLFAFGFYKVIQDYYDHPLIASGCFSVYRTAVLKAQGGWPTRTMAEDMDLTWSLYQAGHGVRFVPGAQCYPVEPRSLHFMIKQLRRWSHGFLQNVRLHWRGLLAMPMLRAMVAVALYDALLASLVFLLLLPVLALLVSPLFLLGYLVDLPAVALPVLVFAARRREVGKALASLPGFLVLRFLNAALMLQAAWREFVVRQPLLVYEKGH